MKITSYIFLLLLISASTAWADEKQNAFSPRQGATELVVKTIGEAERSVCVAAYSFTSEPIAQALIDAHGKGVDVTVVLDKSQRKQKRSLYHRLKERGIPTRINDNYAIMHNKFMVIDEKVLQLGSFNYTKAAEKRNAENVLVVRRNKKVIRSYADQCRKLWEEADQEDGVTEGTTYPTWGK
ncbi:MAG: phospholipase D family protein [Alphaproteobacteria bacterium]|nr:phospholipase D family protein [Alphaproteobacteria bacterium]